MFLKYKLLACSVFLLVFLFGSCDTRNEWYNDDFRKSYNYANKMYVDTDKTKAQTYITQAYNERYIRPAVVRYLYYSFETMYFINTDSIDKSLSYADSALDVLEEHKLYKHFYGEYIHSLLDKGYILSMLGKHDQAYDCYLKAGLIAEDKLDICSRNEYNYHIAMSLYRQEKYTSAFHYFEKTFNDADKCTPDHKPYHRMQEVLDNMGLCCMMRKQYDSGYYYYDSGLSFIRKYADKMGGPRTAEMAEAVIYKNKASTMAYLGNYDTAAALLLQCIDISLQPGYDSGLALSAKIVLAGVYHEDHKYDKMYRELQEVRKGLDAYPRPWLERFWKEWMFIYYESMGRYKEAYKGYHESVTYNDLMRNQENKEKTDIVAELKDKQQQYQIAMLKKNSELDKVYLWITVLFSILSVIIILLVYQYYKKSRQKSAEISKQKDALEQSNKEKDRILSVVAHDLRNPVGAIAYLADMLLVDDSAVLSPQESLEIIKNSSLTSLALINELVGFSQDEISDVEKEYINLNQLVKNCALMLDYKVKEKGQRLQVNVPDNIIEILANREKINRAISNIVSNAIKFSSENTIIHISVTRENNVVLISVKDNGIGIPAHMLPGLFEVFTTSKRDGTAGEKSYGLGLSVSKKIIEAHGGKIRVESEEGNGSTFYIALQSM